MNYLTKYTVTQLKEIADRMGIAYTSRSRKHDIVTSIQTMIHGDWSEAIVIDDEILQADEDKYIAEREAKVIFTYRGINFNTGWNCCRKSPAMVMTFDDGARWAVCKSCSNKSGNKISELPVGAVEAHAKDAATRDAEGFKVPAAKQRQTLRIRAYMAQVGSIRAITPKQMKRITKKANQILKRNGMFESNPHLMTISGRRKAGKGSLV